VRSVVLASRMVHAGIATSIASERICIDPRTLLRLPIGLCLQILDLPLFAGPWSAPSEPFLGFIEAGVSVNFFGAAQETES
jgi:hypothetical protein